MITRASQEGQPLSATFVEGSGVRRRLHQVRGACLGAAFVVADPVGRQSMTAHGPQGLAESVYAYLSQAQNNGSAMAYTGFIQPVAGNIGAHGITFADIAGGVI